MSLRPNQQKTKNIKKRIDVLLVEMQLVDSRQKAQAEIIAGNVLVDTTPITKPGTQVSIHSDIRLKQKSPYVSRGALKLIHAINYFHIRCDGLVAIDVGSSTGGFTEILLKNNAVLVYAVDSGTNQLDWKLRNDRHVVVMENTNARYIDQTNFDPQPQIATIDVSFISLTRILLPLKNILPTNAPIIALIKPQFELDKKHISKGGFVKPEHRQKAIKRILEYATSIGLEASEVIESPIVGAKSKNVEFLSVFIKK